MHCICKGTPTHYPYCDKWYIQNNHNDIIIVDKC